MAQLCDGSLVYIVKRLGEGTDRMLSPEEFSRFYYRQEASRGWLFTLFNVTSAWIGLGCGRSFGQLLFTGRMLVQWFASERTSARLSLSRFGG